MADLAYEMRGGGDLIFPFSSFSPSSSSPSSMAKIYWGGARGGSSGVLGGRGGGGTPAPTLDPSLH